MDGRASEDSFFGGDRVIGMNDGVLSLIIFALCVILFIWDKLPMATTAILGCAVMVVSGVCDFKTAFEQFAGSTVIMLVGVFVMGAAITESGLASQIGGLVRRISGKGERIFIAVSFVIAMLLSAFVTNVTVLAIFMPIVFAVSKENREINPLNVIIPLTLAVNIGGISTLVGSSQQMTAQGLLQEYGFRGFGVFEFAPFGLMLGAVILAYVLLVGYPLGKKIWGQRASEERDSDEKAVIEAPPVSRSKIVAMIIIFVLTVFFYITRGIPFTSIKIEPHVTSTLGALACIITGCITQKKAVSAINWNIVGRLGGCLGLAKALSVAGGIDIVSGWFMKLGGAGLSPLLLFTFTVILTQVMSLFISNSTAISISLLTVISLSSVLPLNMPAYAMGIVLSASMGASCPLSGSTWGVSMAAGYRFGDYFKYGVWADILALAVILISVPLLMPLTV